MQRRWGCICGRCALLTDRWSDNGRDNRLSVGESGGHDGFLRVMGQSQKTDDFFSTFTPSVDIFTIMLNVSIIL